MQASTPRSPERPPEEGAEWEQQESELGRAEATVEEAQHTDLLCHVSFEPESVASRPGADAMDDPVRMYLLEIGRVPLLTPEAEQGLARKLEDGEQIDRLEAQLGGPEGRPVQSVALVLEQLWRLCRRKSTTTFGGRRPRRTPRRAALCP